MGLLFNQFLYWFFTKKIEKRCLSFSYNHAHFIFVKSLYKLDILKITLSNWNILLMGRIFQCWLRKTSMLWHYFRRMNDITKFFQVFFVSINQRYVDCLHESHFRNLESEIIGFCNLMLQNPILPIHRLRNSPFHVKFGFSILLLNSHNQFHVSMQIDCMHDLQVHLKLDYVNITQFDNIS